MHISVVILNYNGLADTIECLASLHRCDLERTRIIVVDNGTELNAGTTILERYPDVHYIKSPVNSGWSGGNNLGIEEALRPSSGMFSTKTDSVTHPPADIVFLLNNDTIVDDQILGMLRDAMDRGYDIVGPVINEFDSPQLIQTQGTAFNRVESREFFSVIPTPPDASLPPKITDVDIVNGCAVAITRRVFDCIGLIDERFFLICEESDFCLRAQNAGFCLGVIHRALVWHKHSVSFNRAGKPLQRYYGTRNLWLLLKKHPNGQGRRSTLRSKIAYFWYQYHMYCHERELGNRPGASAITDGISDAMLGRYGAKLGKKSWLSRLVYNLFSCVWWLRSGMNRQG
jgi:GT2 family glycosyltransferase